MDNKIYDNSEVKWSHDEVAVSNQEWILPYKAFPF